MTDRIITYSEAIREAIGQAMEADPNVFMLGEDIGIYGGALVFLAICITALELSEFEILQSLSWA